MGNQKRFSINSTSNAIRSPSLLTFDQLMGMPLELAVQQGNGVVSPAAVINKWGITQIPIEMNKEAFVCLTSGEVWKVTRTKIGKMPFKPEEKVCRVLLQPIIREKLSELSQDQHRIDLDVTVPIKVRDEYRVAIATDPLSIFKSVISSVLRRLVSTRKAANILNNNEFDKDLKDALQEKDEINELFELGNVIVTCVDANRQNVANAQEEIDKALTHAAVKQIINKVTDDQKESDHKRNLEILDVNNQQRNLDNRSLENIEIIRAVPEIANATGDTGVTKVLMAQMGHVESNPQISEPKRKKFEILADQNKKFSIISGSPSISNTSLLDQERIGVESVANQYGIELEGCVFDHGGMKLAFRNFDAIIRYAAGYPRQAGPIIELDRGILGREVATINWDPSVHSRVADVLDQIAQMGNSGS